MNSTVNHLLRQTWRLIIFVVGGTLLLGGLVMLLTPGPGLIGIALGLSVLAVEFAWARRLLKRVKDEIKRRTGSREVDDSQKAASECPPPRDPPLSC